MNLTLAYRCVAERKGDVSRVAPSEKQTGMTMIDEILLPVFFETDDLPEMEEFVEKNGIVCFEE